MILSMLASMLVFLIFRSRKNPLLDPYTIFFLAYLYYSYYIPILMILSGYYELGELGVFVTDANIASLMYLNFFSFVLFSLSYRAVDFAFKDDLLGVDQDASNKMGVIVHRSQQRALIGSLVAIFLVVAMVFPSELAAVQADYANKIFTIYTSSTFVAFETFWLILLAATFAHLLLHSVRPIRTFAVATTIMCILSFATYSKTPFIYILCLGFVLVFRVARRLQLPAVAFFVFGFMLALVTIVPSFSQYRATGRVEFVDFTNMDVQQVFSDARGPLFTTILSLDYANAPQMPSLLSSWILWIPRFVWPDRPYDVAEAFAQANMPGWQPGFGYGMSPLTEGILRFENFFAPAIFIFFGLTINIQRHLLLRLVHEKLRPALDMVMFGQLMFIANRGPLSGLMTNTLQFWLPFLVMAVIIQWIFGVKLLSTQKTRNKMPKLSGNGS